MYTSNRVLYCVYKYRFKLHYFLVHLRLKITFGIVIMLSILMYIVSIEFCHCQSSIGCLCKIAMFLHTVEICAGVFIILVLKLYAVLVFP